MSIIADYSRILTEEAGKVLRIAGKGPGEVEQAFERAGQIAGGIGGGALAGPAGGGGGAGIGGWVAGQLHDLLFGDSSQHRRTDMGKQARHCIGRMAHVLGAAVVAEMDRKGLEEVFDAIAGDAPLARFSDYLGEDLTQLRGVPRGKGQAAAKAYMDAAAPPGSVRMPAQLYESEAWVLLAGVWSPFGDIAARFAAVAAALDAGGLPDHAAGRAQLRRDFPQEWARVESAGQIFEAPGSTSRSARTSKNITRPKQTRQTVSRKNTRSGGGVLLGGTLVVTLIGAGVAAAARKRGRRR
jgi:hypothetical protein